MIPLARVVAEKWGLAVVLHGEVNRPEEIGADIYGDGLPRLELAGPGPDPAELRAVAQWWLDHGVRSDEIRAELAALDRDVPRVLEDVIAATGIVLPPAAAAKVARKQELRNQLKALG